MDATERKMYRLLKPSTLRVCFNEKMKNFEAVTEWGYQGGFMLIRMDGGREALVNPDKVSFVEVG